MLNLFEWWNKRTKKKRKEKKKIEFEKGFANASSELLKGRSPMDLYYFCECSYYFSDQSDFDWGILDALERWKKLTGIEYDYMNL